MSENISEIDLQALIEQYVTSVTADVFALKNLKGMAGAILARYSRARGGVRDIIKEFVKDGVLDASHAEELIKRILIAFGDDSVGELEGAHLCIENTSVLFTKDVEDRRIGGSPIEQSTRYVIYDQKDADGNWRYYRGDEVINSSFGNQYVQTMDSIFDSYSSLVAPLKAYLEEQKPLEKAEYDINNDGVKETWADLADDEKLQKDFRTTYNIDLKTKACDILRALLPLATKTNVGLFGNGRYYQETMSSLLTKDLPESNAKVGPIADALNGIIPLYIYRAGRREYNAAINKAMFELVAELFGDEEIEIPAQVPQYKLMDRGEVITQALMDQKNYSLKLAMRKAADISTIAAMLFPYTNKSLNVLKTAVMNMSEEKQKNIWDTYMGDRESRRNRPGRALEDGYPYTFNLVTNFGVYKDLERHRMCTQQRQLFTTKLGFVVPPEIEAIGAVGTWKACFTMADALFDAIAAENATIAQYAVLHGHYVRWMIGMNDRAMMHMLELRTTPQGHPHYRIAGQEMHKLICERDPWRGEAMKFVDHNHYDSNRGDSEAKQRAKEAELERKLGST